MRGQQQQQQQQPLPQICASSFTAIYDVAGGMIQLVARKARPHTTTNTTTTTTTAATLAKCVLILPHAASSSLCVWYVWMCACIQVNIDFLYFAGSSALLSLCVLWNSFFGSMDTHTYERTAQHENKCAHGGFFARTRRPKIARTHIRHSTCNIISSVWSATPPATRIRYGNMVTIMDGAADARARTHRESHNNAGK